MIYEVSVIKNFSAAHALRGYKGKCENMHGHNWKVKIAVSGEKLGPEGMLLDFTELKAIADGILSELDHRNLNEVLPFDASNPTAENIAAHIYSETAKRLPQGTELSYVEVWESETSSARVSIPGGRAQDSASRVFTAYDSTKAEKLISRMKSMLYYTGTLLLSLILLTVIAAFIYLNVLGNRNSNRAALKQARQQNISGQSVVKDPEKYLGKPVEWHCRYLNGNRGILAGSDIGIEILGLDTSNIKAGKMVAYTVLGRIKSVRDNTITVEGIDVYQTE